MVTRKLLATFGVLALVWASTSADSAAATPAQDSWVETWDSALSATYYGAQDRGDGVFINMPATFQADNGTYTFASSAGNTTIVSLVTSMFAEITAGRLVLAALPSTYDPGVGDICSGFPCAGGPGCGGSCPLAPDTGQYYGWQAAVTSPPIGLVLQPTTTITLDGSAQVSGGNSHRAQLIVEATPGSVTYVFNSTYAAPGSISIQDVSNFGVRNLWNDFQNARGGTAPNGTVDRLTFVVEADRYCNCFADLSVSFDNIRIESLLTETPTPTPTPTPSPTAVRLAYYGLGDSVAAGHGLPGETGRCRRARGAYPNLVILGLTADLTGRYDEIDGFHYACSGAQSVELATQVDSVLASLASKPPDSTVALVSITIGANDYPWANPSALGPFLCSPQAQFDATISQITSGVATNVTAAIQRLVSNGNVHVVLTDYHTPFNQRSRILDLLRGPPGFFVRVPPLGTRVFVPNPFFHPSCMGRSLTGLYARTENAVRSLNQVLLQAASAFPADRVGFASVPLSLHGHESPEPFCGTAPPNPGMSWVQFPLQRPTVPLLGGDDCFHPNQRGARTFARVVQGVAEGLLP